MGTIIRNESEGEYRNGRTQTASGTPPADARTGAELRSGQSGRARSAGICAVPHQRPEGHQRHRSRPDRPLWRFCRCAGSQRGRTVHCGGRRPGHSPDAASAAGDQPLLWPQPYQHHPLHQNYGADGQLSDGEVCVVGLRACNAGQSGQP